MIGSVGGLEVEKFSYTHMPDYRDDITAVDYTAFSGGEVPGDIEVEAHPEPPFTESTPLTSLSKGGRSDIMDFFRRGNARGALLTRV